MGVLQMSGTRIGCPALAIGLGAVLVAVAACAAVDVARPSRRRPAKPPAGRSAHGSARSLDDNNDGRLSRAELKPEPVGAPDAELAYEELVGATEQEYVASNLVVEIQRMIPEARWLRRCWPEFGF
jgi:hypothetical protein